MDGEKKLPCMLRRDAGWQNVLTESRTAPQKMDSYLGGEEDGR